MTLPGSDFGQFHVGGDLLHRVMVGGFKRTDRSAENFRHLLIFHLVVIAHVEDETLFFREVHDRLLEGELEFVAVEIFVAFEIAEEKRLVVLVARDVVALALLVEEIDRLVDGDLIEPCREFGVAPEIVEVVPGFEEAVLEQVVGILVTGDHLSGLPIDRFAVGAHQRVESLLCRFRCLQIFHQLLLVYWCPICHDYVIMPDFSACKIS